MSQMLAFYMFGVSVNLSCSLVPFLRVGSCAGCGSVAAGLLDPNANSMAAFVGGEATPSSLDERFLSALVVAVNWVWTLPSVFHAQKSMTAGAAGWMEDDFVHHVFEAALPQFGCSSSFSENGSLLRASCAAMPRCVFSILREGLEPAHRVRGLALPAALRLSSWKLLCSGLVESCLVIIYANAVDFHVVCSGSLACGPGSKEKSQSKVFQLTWGFIKSPSQVGMFVAAAAALSEILMHFVSQCIGAAAASAIEGVLVVFLLLLFGWFGILALPVAFPMFVEDVFLLLFLLGCLLLHTYLWYFAVATLFAAAAYVAFDGLFTLEGNGKVVFEYIVGVRQGSRFAFEQAKATPRVDVAETPQASPFLEAQGKTIIQSGPSLVSSRSLLVRALTGQTLVVRWSSSEDVLLCVSERTGVPLHAFYLTLNGKCLMEETLHSMDRSSPIPLVMHGRLRGGSSSSVPGDWVCSRCHIGGCWPTKSRCYRCGAPRHSASQDVGPSLPRRESTHPGRAPKPKPAPVNPTFREPRVIPPKKGGTPPATSAPSPTSAASQLDPTAIVTLLRSLGLTEELLSQVRAAFPPPPAQNPKKEQKLLQLRGQIDAAKKHVDRLERSVTHHRSQLHVCMENKGIKEAEVAKLENEYRLLTDFKLSPNAAPAASAHVSPAHSVCESEEENAMDLEGAPPVSFAPVSSPESAAPTGAQDLPDSKRPRRSMPSDSGLSSSQPLLYGMVATCTDDQCSALLEQLRARQNQLDLEREGRERDAALNCDSDPDLLVSGV